MCHKFSGTKEASVAATDLSHSETLFSLPRRGYKGLSVKMGELLSRKFSHYKLHLYGKINDIAYSIFHTCCCSKVINYSTGRQVRMAPAFPGAPAHPSPAPREAWEGKPVRDLSHPAPPAQEAPGSVGNTTAHLPRAGCEVL